MGWMFARSAHLVFQQDGGFWPGLIFCLRISEQAELTVAKTLNDCWHGSRGIQIACPDKRTLDISGLGTIDSRQSDHKQNPLASPSTSDVTHPGTTASRREWWALHPFTDQRCRNCFSSCCLSGIHACVVMCFFGEGLGKMQVKFSVFFVLCRFVYTQGLEHVYRNWHTRVTWGSYNESGECKHFSRTWSTSSIFSQNTLDCSTKMSGILEGGVSQPTTMGPKALRIAVLQ